MKRPLLFVLAVAIGPALSCGGTSSSPGRKDAAQEGGLDAAVPAGLDGHDASGGGALGSGGIGGVGGGGGSLGTGGGSAGATGGNQDTGGAIATGGRTAVGGTSAAGGMNANGGTTTSMMGGTTAGGGATSSGGIVTTGGKASGGSTATGGQAATGGTTATGGQTASGGRTASGGTTATGGGGGSGTGGIPSTGGTTGAGGATSNGGSTGSSGTTPTGGTTGAGGATSNGGSTGSGGTTSLSGEFASDAEGWGCDFADYPPNIGTGYDLACGWSALPTEVGPGGGLQMNSNNHSDDMFMYLMHQITGLAPQTKYLLDVVAVIDTNAPADCGGIGGSPGGSVTVKIGAVTSQPTTSTDSLGWLHLDLDKGNQSTGGVDMKVVGDLGNTKTCPDLTYEPKTFTLSGFSVTSASDGTLWLILGTDSGFEGITTIYYDRVALTLRPGN
jgi:hypothetical protein